MKEENVNKTLHKRSWPTPKDKYENLLLALLEQHAGIEEVWSYPIGLILDPSSICQLKCPFCINHFSPPIRTRTLMSIELFEKIIDEMGRYLFTVWLFNWGEPFLNKHIVDMVKLLKKHGVEVILSSHFSMPISDAIIYALIENELDVLIVAIDGMTQDTYSQYRVKGDVKLALSNVERFARAKRDLGASKPHIDWQFLVFSFNEKELPEAKKYADQIGVDLRPALPFVNMETHSHWLSSDDKYVLEIYKKKAEYVYPPVDSQSLHNIQHRIESLAKRFYRGCDWHYLISAINANGSVSACSAIMDEAEDFGSLNDKMFFEIWNNQLYKDARRYLKSQRNVSESPETKNVCLTCKKDEIIMGCGQHFLRNALLSSPHEVKEKAQHLIPCHPTVKEALNNMPISFRC